MKMLIGIIFIVLGIIPLIYWVFKEDSKTYLKIMSGVICGVFVLGGLVITFMI